MQLAPETNRCTGKKVDEEISPVEEKNDSFPIDNKRERKNAVRVTYS